LAFLSIKWEFESLCFPFSFSSLVSRSTNTYGIPTHRGRERVQVGGKRDLRSLH
jgi:hypothetical protein